MAEKTREEKIADMLDTPEQSSMGDMSVRNRSVADAIAVDKHLAKKSAASSGRMGLRVGKFNGPGQY